MTPFRARVAMSLARLRSLASLAAHRLPPRVRTAVLDARWRLAGAPEPTGRRPDVDASVPVRLLIGPANFAGQGFRWARAVEAHLAGTRAVNVEIGSSSSPFNPASDQSVPALIGQGHPRWGPAQYDWVIATFSHVMIEAARPLFGPMFQRDLAEEIAALQSHGLALAMMAHGTDVRLPSEHAERERWSPFREPLPDLPLREMRAISDRAVFQKFEGPIFCSTPDLVHHVPAAIWCPVVVNLERWRAARRGSSTAVPLVVHAPSNAVIKGSALIQPAMTALHADGTISYERLQHVKAAQMPQAIGRADMVLDQFRIGSYGVAACEAMAAGKVVIGHVRPEVRAVVASLTGRELPVVEATPETIEDVVRDLASRPDRRAELGRQGRTFVEHVHDGTFSARVLAGWLGAHQ